MDERGLYEMVQQSAPKAQRATRFPAFVIAAALCGILMSACGTWMFPDEARINTEVLHELRSVAKVLKEVEWKDAWGDTDFFGRVLIADGRGVDNATAVKGILNTLKGLGWKITDQPYNQYALSSNKWPDVELRVADVDAYIYNDDENAQVKLAIAQAAKVKKSGSLVILAVSPIG